MKKLLLLLSIVACENSSVEIDAGMMIGRKSITPIEILDSGTPDNNPIDTILRNIDSTLDMPDTTTDNIKPDSQPDVLKFARAGEPCDNTRPCESFCARQITRTECPNGQNEARYMMACINGRCQDNVRLFDSHMCCYSNETSSGYCETTNTNCK